MMNVKRLACVASAAAFLIVGSAHAFQTKTSSPASTTDAQPAGAYTAPEALTPLVSKPKPGLQARQPVPKAPFVHKPQRVHEMLVVKFGDPVVGPGAVARDGSLRLNPAFEEFEAELKGLTQRFGIEFKYAIPHDQEMLNALYQRAEQRSGRMQPNLKSYMYVTGDEANLEHVAGVLHGMDIVENVQWYEDMRPQGGTGACCLPSGNCSPDLTPGECIDAGGEYQGDGTTCAGVTCEQAGACCIQGPTGAQCQEVTLSDCDRFGGFFHGEGTSCDDVTCTPGGCCFGDSCVPDVIEASCVADGGFWLGPGASCTDDNDQNPCENIQPDCGDMGTGSCFLIDGSNNTPFCDNQACCEFVCDQDPFCCDEDNPTATFDEFCASMANQICAAPPADRCATPLNGHCLEPNPAGGCRNQQCCETVSMIDAFCEQSWDAGCVELARVNCGNPGDTLDYTPLQGYRTPSSYLAELGDIPDELEPLLPAVDTGESFLGFGGEGWFLFDDDDDFGGLYGLGTQLLEDFFIDEWGEGVLTRGKTIKVAVIEWAWWGPEPFEDDNGNDEFDSGENFTDLNGDGVYTASHEDLDVISEPGQTMLLIPTITEPDHGTATLSIINAVENGFGMTGIAPDAQAYFFPLTSVEEGPRQLAAWTSAINTLGPGDVISASYGPGPPIGNLNNSQIMWPLLRMASDLGITTCIAAGNDCFNLDDAPDLGDSGAMVVGACSPGVPYYRLAFSNFCTNPDNDRSNIVHVKAWGTAVASCGYGDLSAVDGDPYRSYALNFGGTSAAAPQIAGLSACLQGLSKQFFGIPLTPEQIRGSMGAPGSPPPNPSRLFGGFEGVNCRLDLNPDVGPHMIGPYPDAAGNFDSASSAILNQFFIFGQSPNIEDIVVLNGNLVFGSKFSVMGIDQNYLVVESEQANRSGPSVPANLPANVPAGVINSASYFTNGQISDVLAVGKSPVPTASNMTIQVLVQPPTGFIALQVVEAYDWLTGQWVFGNVAVLNGGADVLTTTSLADPTRFIRPSNQQILFRVWDANFGFNSGVLGGTKSGRQQPFDMRYDWFTVDVTEGFATPSIPPPSGLR